MAKGSTDGSEACSSLVATNLTQSVEPGRGTRSTLMPSFSNQPSLVANNGFVALEDYLKNNRKEAVALARGYAKGTVFAMANPEAAIRILWEIYPQTKSTGKDEATALRDDLITLEARARNWRYEQVDGKRWGDNVEANYQAYLDWLLEQGIIKTKTDAKDIVSNELLGDAINFDEKALIEEAKAYKPQ